MKRKADNPSNPENVSGQFAPEERKFSVCIFRDRVALKPRKRLNLTWAKFVELCQERELRPDKSGPMLGTYKLKSGGGRYNVDVLYLSLILIDIDTEGKKDEKSGRVLKVTKAAPSLEEIRKRISSLEWVATSTHWHEPSRGVNKFRFALLPDRNIDPGEHKHVLEALDEMLGGVLDRSAWALSQAFYLPSCPGENEQEAVFLHNKGGAFCVDEFVRRGREILVERQTATRTSRVVTPQVSMAETPKNIEYVASLLNAIPADVDRATWRSLLWSVASLEWQCGEALAREWSETSPEKYDADDFDGVWESYDPAREKKVTVGTLVYVARKYGAPVEKPKIAFTGFGADIFNGRKFAELFRNQLLNVHETNQWLKFDPLQGWITAPPGEPERAAKMVVKSLWDELAEMGKRKL